MAGGITEGKEGEWGLDCNIWSCVGAAVMAALLPGAPMHGSGRHRKPDLFLLAEGLICPSEAGREGLGRTDGRTDDGLFGGKNIMMKPENLTTIADGGVAERGRIIYETQNGTTISLYRPSSNLLL